MNEFDKKQIEYLFDVITKKVANRELKVQQFDFYSKLLKSIFFKSYKIHKQKRKCIYDGCNNLSIRNSHSIPKSSSLRLISTKGKLLTPSYDFKSKFFKNKISPIGVSEASTFPGFCEKHEKEFQIYEHSGEIDNEYKAFLQTFRAICREIILKKNQLIISEKELETYRNKVESEAIELLNMEISNIKQKGVFTKYNIQGIDSIIISYEKLKRKLQDTIIKLESISNIILKEVIQNKNKNNINLFYATLDMKLPISLCGFASASYSRNHIENEMFIIMNVIPTKDKTFVICVGEKKDEEIFQSYINFYSQNALTLINMIESFMVNGSDHWYINPSYWSKIDNKTQEIILTDILQSSDSFLYEYPNSIFSDIRIDILENFENRRGKKLSKIDKLFIQKEREKLSNKEKWKKISETDLKQKIYEWVDDKKL